jgi:hypothetical protein
MVNKASDLKAIRLSCCAAMPCLLSHIMGTGWAIAAMQPTGSASHIEANARWTMLAPVLQGPTFIPKACSSDTAGNVVFDASQSLSRFPVKVLNGSQFKPQFKTIAWTIQAGSDAKLTSLLSTVNGYDVALA